MEIDHHSFFKPQTGVKWIACIFCWVSNFIIRAEIIMASVTLWKQLKNSYHWNKSTILDTQPCLSRGTQHDIDWYHQRLNTCKMRSLPPCQWGSAPSIHRIPVWATTTQQQSWFLQCWFLQFWMWSWANFSWMHRSIRSGGCHLADVVPLKMSS